MIARIFISIFLISSSVCIGQTVKVVGPGQSPDGDVAYFNANKSKSTLTNAKVLADLSNFQDSSLLLFQHPSYQEVTILKFQIKDGSIQLLDKVFEMNDVIVSANKWEQDISEIPNIILSVSAENVTNNNPQTSADLLAQSGEVFVQKSQLGGGSPKIRGFSANSTLIVVDGVRMNNAIYRSGNLQNLINVDPNSLEGAEVIMGPGSVIYGSDALGGVMDFHTKEITFEAPVSANGLIRYSSASNEKTGHADILWGTRRLSGFSSFTYSTFSDLRSGSNRNEEYPDFGKRFFYASKNESGDDILKTNDNENEQIVSGFDSWNLVQKLSFKASNNLQLTYGLYYSTTSDIPRYDRLIEPVENGIGLANAEWFYGPQRWLMHSLKTELKSKNRFFDQARIIAAYQGYEESRNDREFGDNRLRTRTETVDIYSLNVDFDKGIKGDHSLFYGLELFYNDVDSEGFRRNLDTGETTAVAPRYPDDGSQYYSGALYASYIHRWPKVVFSGGLRFNAVGLNAKTSDPSAQFLSSDRISLNNSAINGSLGVVYRGLSGHKLSWLFSTGFRAPNVDDVGKIFELNESNILVPNQNLKPETSYNTEISWSGTGSNIEWRLTGFFTYLNNAILRAPFHVNGQDSVQVEGVQKRVFAQNNVSEAFILGGSLALNYQITEHLKTALNLTETLGEERNTREPLRHTTPVFGRLSVMYEQKKNRLELFTEFNGPRLRSDIPTAEIDAKPYLYATHISDSKKDGSPGWVTLNFRYSYQLNNNISFSTAIENIFDRHYRPYSSGISAPGRNIVFAIRGSI